jgi:hypothetical protein
VTTNRRAAAFVPVASLILLLTIACPCLATDNDRASQEDDVREAVFRFQFDHNASGQQKTARAYCLAILTGEKDSDPSSEFIKRFAHHKTRVRKASDCHCASFHVVENRFGRPALIFRVSNITWVADTGITVEGGYEEGNLSSSGNTYTVKKQNGKGFVTNNQMNFISRNFDEPGSACRSCAVQ